jgi:hypothetical protein
MSGSAEARPGSTGDRVADTIGAQAPARPTGSDRSLPARGGRRHRDRTRPGTLAGRSPGARGRHSESTQSPTSGRSSALTATRCCREPPSTEIRDIAHVPSRCRSVWMAESSQVGTLEHPAHRSNAGVGGEMLNDSGQSAFSRGPRSRAARCWILERRLFLNAHIKTTYRP